MQILYQMGKLTLGALPTLRPLASNSSVHTWSSFRHGRRHPRPTKNLSKPGVGGVCRGWWGGTRPVLDEQAYRASIFVRPHVLLLCSHSDGMSGSHLVSTLFLILHTKQISKLGCL